MSTDAYVNTETAGISTEVSGIVEQIDVTENQASANAGSASPNSRTRWRRFKVNGWYGRSERLLQIVSGTAIWHHPGRLVPIRYVLVRDVAGEFKPQAFLCTDLDTDPLDILRWFVRRWSIEVVGSR